MHFWPYGATILAGILGILFLAVLAYCCLKEIRRQSEDDDLSKAENGTASSVQANNARRRSNDRTGNFREQSSAKNRQPKATGEETPSFSPSFLNRSINGDSTAPNHLIGHVNTSNFGAIVEGNESPLTSHFNRKSYKILNGAVDGKKDEVDMASEIKTNQSSSKYQPRYLKDKENKLLNTSTNRPINITVPEIHITRKPLENINVRNLPQTFKTTHLTNNVHDPRPHITTVTLSTNQVGAQRPTPSVSYQRRIVPTISTEDEKRKQHYGLRKKGTLDVYQVINENQKIPPTTKNRHLYCEPGGLDKSKALKISQERGTDFATSISPVNTVFRNSKGYLLCKTNDAKYPSLVMSKEKVETFQCRYNKSTETWSASFEGHFHSIFTINATHFPGYVYRNVNFHNDTRKYLN